MKLFILLAAFLLGSLKYEVRGQSGSGGGWFERDDEDDIIVDGAIPTVDDDDGIIVDDAIPTEDDDDSNSNEIHITNHRKYGKDTVFYSRNNDDGDDDNDDGDDDDNDDDDNDNNDDETEGDDDDYDVYVTDCENFNLELCLHDYENYDLFSALSKDDALCWESYASVSCLHGFAKECFPDSDTKEEYLCKLNYFKDRITVLCLNDTMEKEQEVTDEEILQCLEGAEVDAVECVEQTHAQLRKLIKQRIADTGAFDTDNLNCRVASNVLKCTLNRLEDRCPQEAIDAFMEGAEQKLFEILGYKCPIETITEVLSLK